MLTILTRDMAALNACYNRLLILFMHNIQHTTWSSETQAMDKMDYKKKKRLLCEKMHYPSIIMGSGNG